MFMSCLQYTGRILKHKYWVAYYTFKAGLYWQGITHDLSKFSPAEFLPSAAYFSEDKSSVLIQKKAEGYSSAWLHHKGHNPHHYEYWIDNLDSGGIPIQMPYKYALELVCDYLGACHAYEKNFSYQKGWELWRNKRDHVKMHPQTKHFVSLLLEGCYLTDGCEILKKAPELFEISNNWYKEMTTENGESGV